MKDDKTCFLKVINERKEIGKRMTIMTVMRITSLIEQEMVYTHAPVHVDVLMLSRHFELIPTSFFRVMSILKMSGPLFTSSIELHCILHCI